MKHLFHLLLEREKNSTTMYHDIEKTLYQTHKEVVVVIKMKNQ